MRNEEFEIVRDLIAGRGQQWPVPAYTARAIAPASFREIDGQELARQYVAHRKFKELEMQAMKASAGEARPDSITLEVPLGERRLNGSMQIPPDAPSAGWFSSVARRLWRR